MHLQLWQDVPQLCYFSPATFKASSQLPTIFYLHSNVSREAGKLAAVLSAVPTILALISQKIHLKTFLQPIKKEEAEKVSSSRKVTEKPVASIILKSDNFHGPLSSPYYQVLQHH